MNFIFPNNAVTVQKLWLQSRVEYSQCVHCLPSAARKLAIEMKAWEKTRKQNDPLKHPMGFICFLSFEAGIAM